MSVLSRCRTHIPGADPTHLAPLGGDRLVRVDFDERLRVPLRWWVQATMFVASVWLAFIVALPPVVAWLATGVISAVVVSVFWGYGSARLRIAGGTFTAGRAQIPVVMLAEPVVLDTEEMRRTTGVEANARAYLLIRPYLKRGVKVSVADPADPAPYWLVATRHPDELAAALSAAAAAGLPNS